PDELADIVHAVRDTREVAELDVWGEAAQVVVAASGSDGERRSLNSWARDVTAIDRVPQRDVDELAGADVADRREARLERPLRVDVRSHRDVDRTPPEDVLVVIRWLRGDVRVAVDESGQHGRPAQVDHARVRGNR